MEHSGFFRSDSLPSNTALGYLTDADGLQTNLFKLPIIDTGDGGAYSTLHDMHFFWSVLKAGVIITPKVLEPFIETQNEMGENGY